jgi:transcriptional regulator with XRE-family HTH domain
MTNSAFSTRLSKARQAAGYKTARAFANAVGINENRYGRYERGTARPSFTSLCKFCDRLGVTPNDLLGYADVRAPDRRTERTPSGFSDGPMALQDRSHRRLRAGGRRHGRKDEISIDILIWQFAEDFVAVQSAFSGRQRDVDRLQRIARVYNDLSADAVPVLAQLVVSDGFKRAPPAAKHRLQATAQAIIDKLVKGSSSRSS